MYQTPCKVKDLCFNYLLMQIVYTSSHVNHTFILIYHCILVCNLLKLFHCSQTSMHFADLVKYVLIHDSKNQARSQVRNNAQGICKILTGLRPNRFMPSLSVDSLFNTNVILFTYFGIFLHEVLFPLLCATSIDRHSPVYAHA